MERMGVRERREEGEDGEDGDEGDMGEEGGGGGWNRAPIYSMLFQEDAA